ncbi:MAG: peptidase C26 [Sulfobacillus acidophilus]|uniref:Peptidase C26 n=1 Tax=Sulfobacillus acidophilus TaxID=53633 RepID=A0A2T2WMR6_9FIRM|nr:MAG: peptidase C26 [Sulfobacillus acidophilus]
MKPVIGVSTSREMSGGYPRDYVRETYLDAVCKAGGIPMLLANVDESVQLLNHCDGLLLTGGGDVDPQRFGQADQGTQWAGVSEDRDRVELLLVEEANRVHMPIFGICRGVQMLAVAFGGTLIQDIALRMPGTPIKHSQAQPRRRVTHAVTVASESRLAQIVGASALEVNSFHHQAVDQVPSEWRTVAQAEDGVIEAIEHPGDRFLMGVQWHPEDLIGDELAARRLFENFVAVCADWHTQSRRAHVEHSR